MPSSLRTVGAAVLGAALVAVAALSVRAGPAAGAPTTTSDPAAHTITVTGSGSVSLVPDVARINLGIGVTRPTVAAARAEAARIMTAIIASATGQGVATQDVRTVNVSLNPQYDPNCSRAGTCGTTAPIVGYTMSEGVQITVRNLDRAGAVIDAATAAGATNVGGISFEVADPSAAQTSARVAAIGAARVTAEAMARAAGVSLGAVVSIAEASTGPIPYYASDLAAAVPSVPTPVKPGSQDVQAQVTVVYELR